MNYCTSCGKRLVSIEGLEKVKNEIKFSSRRDERTVTQDHSYEGVIRSGTERLSAKTLGLISISWVVYSCFVIFIDTILVGALFSVPYSVLRWRVADEGVLVSSSSLVVFLLKGFFVLVALLSFAVSGFLAVGGWDLFNSLIALVSLLFSVEILFQLKRIKASDAR